MNREDLETDPRKCGFDADLLRALEGKCGASFAVSKGAVWQHVNDLESGGRCYLLQAPQCDRVEEDSWGVERAAALLADVPDERPAFYTASDVFVDGDPIDADLEGFSIGIESDFEDGRVRGAADALEAADEVSFSMSFDADAPNESDGDALIDVFSGEPIERREPTEPEHLEPDEGAQVRDLGDGDDQPERSRAARLISAVRERIAGWFR